MHFRKWALPASASNRKEGQMDTTVSYKTAVCAEYEILLKECEAAQENFDERRKEIRRFHPSGKKVGDEVLRLQANYAKAYIVLRKHVRTCEICQFFAKNAGRIPEYEFGSRPDMS
jgi:hypothetical protein